MGRYNTGDWNCYCSSSQCRYGMIASYKWLSSWYSVILNSNKPYRYSIHKYKWYCRCYYSNYWSIYINYIWYNRFYNWDTSYEVNYEWNCDYSNSRSRRYLHSHTSNIRRRCKSISPNRRIVSSYLGYFFWIFMGSFRFRWFWHWNYINFNRPCLR